MAELTNEEDLVLRVLTALPDEDMSRQEVEEICSRYEVNLSSVDTCILFGFLSFDSGLYRITEAGKGAMVDLIKKQMGTLPPNSISFDGGGE